MFPSLTRNITSAGTSGPGWVHEIKHDGYRLIARRDAGGVRLITRNGYDWSDRYPAVAAAIGTLKRKSCLIDGEVVICDEDVRAVFDLSLIHISEPTRPY